MNTGRRDLIPLTWQEFEERSESLTGCWVEIFHDCSFRNVPLYQYTRGLLERIIWQSGQPFALQLAEMQTTHADKGGLQGWGRPKNISHTYSLCATTYGFTKRLSDPFRNHAWIEGSGYIYFVTLDHSDVIIFPKGVVPENIPFFYHGHSS